MYSILSLSESPLPLDHKNMFSSFLKFLSIFDVHMYLIDWWSNFLLWSYTGYREIKGGLILYMGLKEVDELEIEEFELGAVLKTFHTLQAHFAINTYSRVIFSYNLIGLLYVVIKCFYKTKLFVGKEVKNLLRSESKHCWKGKCPEFKVPESLSYIYKLFCSLALGVSFSEYLIGKMKIGLT